jgi:hypothetical protein
VSVWNDCASAGTAAAQATASQQPTLDADGAPNGLPFVAFDGTNDFLTVPAARISIPSGFTVFMVAKFAAHSGSRTILGKMDIWGSNDGFMLDQAGAGYLIPYISGAGGSGSGIYAADTWTLANLIIDGATSNTTEYKDGATLGLIGGYYPYVESSIDLHIFGMQGFSAGTGLSQMGGGLAELLIFDGVLPEDDRSRVQCYLSEKYALAIPYCD